MKFGLGPYLAMPAAGGADALGEQVALAEQFGYDSVWLQERQTSAGDLVSAAPVAAALAARTEAVRLGVVSLVGLTHPIYLAEDIAVLDCLSGGRVIFAAGRPSEAELRVYRVDPSVAEARFTEALEVIWRSWSPVPYRHDGVHFRVPGRLAGNSEAAGIDRLSVTPKPAQPELPTWLPLRTAEDAELARRLRLPVIATADRRADELAPLLAAAAGGDDPAGARRPTALVRDVFVAESDELAWSIAGPGLAAVYERHQRDGLLPDGEDPLELARERAVIGSPDRCIDELARYRDELGVDHLICRTALPGVEHGPVCEAIRFFGQAIIPEFRMHGFPDELRMREPLRA